MLGAVLLSWLLLGVAWGAFHWIIVPRIADFRPALEAQATKAIGVPVRIGALTTHTNGLIPSLELTQVKLFDPQGRVALLLPRVVVAMSPRSLWRMGFEQLYIDQPELDIRRGADGRVSVAGLDFSRHTGSSADPLNWFFSQREFVIRGGVVRWSDDFRRLEPLTLQAVDVVVRNSGRHHDARLDATPPAPWGERFNVRARFTQPLLSRQHGQWQDWVGQMFAEFSRVDLSELRRHVTLNFDLSQGRGAVRAWVDVDKGRVTRAEADVALSEVAVSLGKDLGVLSLRQITGRLGGAVLPGGFDVFAKSLALDTADGLHWPGGNVRVKSMDAVGHVPAHGELQATRVDLSALAEVAERLPLDAKWRSQLARLAPTGQMASLVAEWKGPLAAPVSYQVKGAVRQLGLLAQDGVPGVQGLDAEFQFSQGAGQAKISVNKGSVDVPDVFQEREIPIDRLTAQVGWKMSPERIELAVDALKFSNVDAQGEAHFKWRTGGSGKRGERTYPGVIDLQAHLVRAEGQRVHRYLPKVIDPLARDYVRDAVRAGTARNVRFVVKGPIAHLPFADPSQGTFKISAEVRDAKLAYVPSRLQPAGELPWPVLSEIDGDLLISGQQLSVKGARARLGDGPGVQVTRVDAHIADLMHTQVSVNADLKGQLPDVFRVIKESPLARMTGQVLSRSVVAGQADIKLQLQLPVADIEQSTVQGSVMLAGNDVQITPDTPRITRAKGEVGFSHRGITLAAQGQMLGGDVRLEGGLDFVASTEALTTPPVVIRASGVVTAEGLRQAGELGLVSHLAGYVSGSAGYNATLGLRQSVPELLVTTQLQGMAVSLPAPFSKNGASAMPLRYQTTVLPRHGAGAKSGGVTLRDRVSLTIGRLGNLAFERDVSGVEPRVLRGAIAVGSPALEPVVWLDQGVIANIDGVVFDADAWHAVLEKVGRNNPAAETSSTVSTTLGYLPNVVVLRADELTLGSRKFNKVVLGADRDGSLWRVNVDSTELNGYVEYREPSDVTMAGSAGRVYARLARWTIAPSAASEVEALLDAQPASIPALDLVVDDFELHGRNLGRLEVEAINRYAITGGPAVPVREWRLNKLNLVMPEATFSASGSWARIHAPSFGTNPLDRRRSVLDFKLDMSDAGKLLERFGMNDVVRRASGKLEGQLAWMGSPFKPDYPSLGGNFTVHVTDGQFLKAEPGMAKLLGVLSLQALPRRLTLDFRDVFREGFSFDLLRGDIAVDKGLARTNNLQMKGVNATVLMEGQADIALETQDIKVLVVPEINAGTASLIATVLNPAVGLGSVLAHLFLRKPLIESSTQMFHVDGSWKDPRVTKVTPAASSAKGASP